ncbi:MAG: site-specific DNA-methyltransferase [Puniceicoccaceae bacterium]|nr:MAG: site-specific DNA-methyltransferase [Puniceicoccaceae bacterium]
MQEQQYLNIRTESPADQAFIRHLKEFNAFGTPTAVESLDGIDYYINEFWTARQRQANRLHEVSYRACFKPQLPRFFIERLTAPGDVVYDPFMGRGTTPLEAALLERTPYGNDTNPLSRALLEPRLKPPSFKAIEKRLRSIPWDSFTEAASPDLLTFYHPKTLAHLEGLRGWLLTRAASDELDAIDKWIRMVAINRLTGHSAGFFSVYTLPPNQAVTVARQKLINEKRQQTPPLRDVTAIILKKSKSLLSQEHPECKRSLLCTAQSSHTPEIPDACVQLTVTSPPFLDVVDYEGDNWLRCWFLGIDPKAVNIASHRKVTDWQNFIRATLVELARITKPGGSIAFEVGEVRNGTIKLEQNVIAAARGLPLHPLGVMINQQDFTKTSNCWGVVNNSSGTNSNRIVVLRRH